MTLDEIKETLKQQPSFASYDTTGLMLWFIAATLVEQTEMVNRQWDIYNNAPIKVKHIPVVDPNGDNPNMCRCKECTDMRTLNRARVISVSAPVGYRFPYDRTYDNEGLPKDTYAKDGEVQATWPGVLQPETTKINYGIFGPGSQGDTLTLYPCQKCGASVAFSNREKHVEWHILLKA